MAEEFKPTRIKRKKNFSPAIVVPEKNIFAPAFVKYQTAVAAVGSYDKEKKPLFNSDEVTNFIIGAAIPTPDKPDPALDKPDPALSSIAQHYKTLKNQIKIYNENKTNSTAITSETLTPPETMPSDKGLINSISSFISRRNIRKDKTKQPLQKNSTITPDETSISLDRKFLDDKGFANFPFSSIISHYNIPKNPEAVLLSDLKKIYTDYKIAKMTPEQKENLQKQKEIFKNKIDSSSYKIENIKACYLVTLRTTQELIESNLYNPSGEDVLETNRKIKDFLNKASQIKEYKQFLIDSKKSLLNVNLKIPKNLKNEIDLTCQKIASLEAEFKDIDAEFKTHVQRSDAEILKEKAAIVNSAQQSFSKMFEDGESDYNWFLNLSKNIKSNLELIKALKENPHATSDQIRSLTLLESPLNTILKEINDLLLSKKEKIQLRLEKLLSLKSSTPHKAQLILLEKESKEFHLLAEETKTSLAADKNNYPSQEILRYQADIEKVNIAITEKNNAYKERIASLREEAENILKKIDDFNKQAEEKNILKTFEKIKADLEGFDKLFESDDKCDAKAKFKKNLTKINDFIWQYYQSLNNKKSTISDDLNKLKNEKAVLNDQEINSIQEKINAAQDFFQKLSKFFLKTNPDDFITHEDLSTTFDFFEKKLSDNKNLNNETERLITKSQTLQKNISTNLQTVQESIKNKINLYLKPRLEKLEKQRKKDKTLNDLKLFLYTNLRKLGLFFHYNGEYKSYYQSKTRAYQIDSEMDYIKNLKIPIEKMDIPSIGSSINDCGFQDTSSPEKLKKLISFIGAFTTQKVKLMKAKENEAKLHAESKSYKENKERFTQILTTITDKTIQKIDKELTKDFKNARSQNKHL